MLSYSSPGVYVEEIDSGARPIEAAGTSTAAFLGLTRTGEAMLPVSLESYEAFRTRFGGISTGGTAPGDRMAFAVRAFFQNGGRLAYVVNVAQGGRRATASVFAGRGSAPKPLFDVRAKHNGTVLNHLDVHLTPVGDPDAGVFDFEVIENHPTGPRVIETAAAVTIGPGLAGSLEAVIANRESRFEVVPAESQVDWSALRLLVFPSVKIARSQLRSAGPALKLQAFGEAPRALNVAWPSSSAPDADIEALNRALAGVPLPGGGRVVAEREGAGARFFVESAVAAAAIKLLNGAALLGETPETRGELMRELVTGVSGGGAPMPTAVLSGTLSLAPAWLQGKHVDVRFGDGYARRARLDDTPQTAMTEVAQRIARALNDDAVPAGLQSLVVRAEDEQCVIEVGPDAPRGTRLSDVTNPAAAVPLFAADDGALRSPRILAEGATLTVEWEESDGWEDPQTVALSPGEKFSDFATKLDELKTSANGQLVVATIDEGQDPFVLSVTGQTQVRRVRISDRGTGDVLTRALFGRMEVVLDNQTTEVSARAATLADFDLDFRLAEDGATGTPLEFDVDLTAATDIDSPQRLAQRLQETFGAQTSSDTVDARVELLADRLLIWDPTQPVEVLEPDAGTATGAALLGLTEATGATSRPLDQLQGSLPLVASLAGGDSGSPGGPNDYEAALGELERRPEVSIICLPDHPWDKGAGQNYLIVEAAIRHAERQKDRMVIVDPPKASAASERLWTDRNSILQANLPTSSYAAVYYPWVLVPPPTPTVGSATLPEPVRVAPSGFAAGVWSATDRQRGVWKAPAGVDARISGISGFQHELTDIEGGALNREGVNALRNLRGSGAVVWGARTAATNVEPQWRYLPVRRTALMIEDSLREALEWAVHQPNRTELWSALRLNIEAFMNRLFRAGAFQPDNPREAYFVQCGLGVTMSQEDIDAGIVRVRIGFAPSKPAEFVVITIEQINERG